MKTANGREILAANGKVKGYIKMALRELVGSNGCPQMGNRLLKVNEWNGTYTVKGCSHSEEDIVIGKLNGVTRQITQDNGQMIKAMKTIYDWVQE